MKFAGKPLAEVRRLRNSALYRPLARISRVYNRQVVDGLHAAGFEDFAPSFPALLSNLDTQGTRIGVLATRAGVTRQAASQLLMEIERCGYVERKPARDDARATVVMFTSRGQKLLARIFELVEEIEGSFAAVIGEREFERLRGHLLAIANAVDPVGAFGKEDEPER